ncbi:MAG: DUF1292 domain-containing protein [Clostridia bacterium]|nr:DUF1292 domain-containing protein [Clostridia bacterium]
MKNEESDIMQTEDGVETIELTDESGKKHTFEIVLHVPYEDKHYVIMHPLDKYPGLDEDSCAIFEMIDDGQSDTVTIIPEEDDDILDTVYAIYVEWATNVEREGCNGVCEGCPGCGSGDDED